MLMLGREARAPLDVVLGAPEEEHESWISYETWVADHQEMMRRAYEDVRINLRQCAIRRKNEYDRRVWPTVIQPGQWVWYYYPRRYTQRRQKWQRFSLAHYLM
jgi:hypothetical protein